MDIKLSCSTWIKEEDEKILKVLEASDRWLSPQELAERTGLPVVRVETTLRNLVRQMKLADSREKLPDFLDA